MPDNKPGCRVLDTPQDLDDGLMIIANPPVFYLVTLLIR
jgi:hypothetical protein